MTHDRDILKYRIYHWRVVRIEGEARITYGLCKTKEEAEEVAEKFRKLTTYPGVRYEVEQRD